MQERCKISMWNVSKKQKHGQWMIPRSRVIKKYLKIGIMKVTESWASNVTIILPKDVVIWKWYHNYAGWKFDWNINGILSREKQQEKENVGVLKNNFVHHIVPTYIFCITFPPLVIVIHTRLSQPWNGSYYIK